jgi:hypothetical protein
LSIFVANFELDFPSIYITALEAAVKASEAILEIYQNEVVAVQKEDAGRTQPLGLQNTHPFSPFCG